MSSCLRCLLVVAAVLIAALGLSAQGVDKPSKQTGQGIAKPSKNPPQGGNTGSAYSGTPRKEDPVAVPLPIPEFRPETAPWMHLRLAMAETARSRNDWSAVARSLQRVLDHDGDALRPPRRGSTWTALHIEADRLIAELPRAGRKAYQSQANADAAALLKKLEAEKGVDALVPMVRRYLHTDPGAAALALLGSRAMEAGEIPRAEAAFALLLRHLGLARWTPEQLLQAARAFRRTGNPHADNVTRELLRRMGRDGLRIEKETYTRDKLQKELDALALSRIAGWLLPGGDASRSARGEGGAPYLSKQWSQTMHRGGRMSPGATKLKQAIDALQKKSEPVLSPFQPLALMVTLRADKIEVPVVICRSHWGLHGIRMENGKTAWEAQSSWGLDRLAGDNKFGRVQALENWANFYLNAAQKPTMFLENSTVGTMSSDGHLLYAVEDFEVPPTPQIEFDDPWGRPGPDRQPKYHEELKKFINHNRLMAVTVNSGNLRWELGGPNDKHGMAGTYFLGPPLPYNGRLYVLNQKGRDLRLLVLEKFKYKSERDPDRELDGIRVLSTKTLAVLRDTIPEDSVRRMRACHLAAGDGVLVCTTNTGAVLGVDLLTGGLRWAYLYHEKGESFREWDPAMLRPGKPLPSPWVKMPDGSARPLLVNSDPLWKVTPPIVVEGKAVFTAPDCHRLLCLDAKSGERLWTRERSADDLYLGGVFDGRVIVVGKTLVRALNLKDGEVLWTAKTGLPSGTGAAAGSVYYLPIQKSATSRESQIYALDMATGRILSRSGAAGKEAFEGGNLVFAHGRLLVQSPTELTVFPLLTTRLAELDEVLKKSPEAVEVRLMRGLARLQADRLPDAVADLEQVLKGKLEQKPFVEARAGLLEAYARLLRADFAKNEKLVAASEKLIARGAEAELPESEAKRRRAALLTLTAAGLEKLGRFDEALSAYMKLAELGDVEPFKPTSDDTDLEQSSGTMARAGLERLLARATPAQRTALRADAVKRLKGLIDKKNRAGFLALAAVLDPGEAEPDLSLTLAEMLLKEKAYAEADLALLRLRGRTANKTAEGQAVALLARSCAERDRLADAAYYYRLLKRDFADVKVRDDKTGTDVFKEIAKDKRYFPHLEDRPRPVWARLQPGTVERGPFPAPKLLRLTVRGGELPVYRDVTLCVRILSRCLELTEGHGESARTSNEDLPGNLFAEAGAELQKPNPPEVQTVGHLLLIPLGSRLNCIDLTSHRWLWQRTLATPQQAASARMTPTAVYMETGKGLEALHPLTGKVIWRRSEIKAPAQLVVDEQYVYVVELDETNKAKATHVFRQDDGSAVKVKDFSDRHRRSVNWTGRRLIWAETDDRAMTLRAYDVLTGKDLWARKYAASSLPLTSLVPELLGVMKRPATIRVIRAHNGEELLAVKVDWEAEGLCGAFAPSFNEVEKAYLLGDTELFYVACVERLDPEVMSPPGIEADIVPGMRLGTLVVDGELVAINRESKKVWFAEARRTALILDHFEEMPLLLMAGRYQTGNPLRGITPRFQTHTHVIDKRTGKLLFFSSSWDDSKPLQPFHSLRLDPAGKRIEFVATDRKITFKAKE